MTDAPDGREKPIKAAHDELSRLNGQVAAMRAVLTQLLQDVVRAEILLEHSKGMQMLEANEQLVISALAAQSDAERAADALDEASRAGGLDPLTGLPNRALLLDRLESAISHSKRHGNRVALLFLDLNGFKQVNDAFGHAAGDEALQLVADCLNSVVRETDTVSRHGGDEFLILLAEVAHAGDAAIVAEKVNAALAEYGRIDTHAARLSASIGISVYPEDGLDAKTLIDRADTAMYAAKRLEQGGFVFHANRSPGQPGLLVVSDLTQQRHVTAQQLEVADHEQRQEQLRDANEQLVLIALGAQELLAAAEDAQRRQARLLALFANELNNPFAPIRLAAAALGRPGVEKTLLPRVQAIIEKQIDKMSRLVGELLDPRHVGKVQSSPGRLTFDITAPIDAAVEACRPMIDRRQQALEVTIPRSQAVSGDPDLPRQVLMRLLTDASLYTDDGGRIQVGAQVVDGRLLLTVVDSGRGMVHDAASAAFDPFVLDPRAGLAEGDGIGTRLAAVCEIVEVHGGTVFAKGVDGHNGSQFTVSLPVGSSSVHDDRLEPGTP